MSCQKFPRISTTGGHLPGWNKSAPSAFRLSVLANFVAVGTGVAPGPPHRSVRALLTHTAPTSGLPYCALGNRGERVGLEVATLIAVASSAPKSHTLSGFAFGVCCARLR